MKKVYFFLFFGLLFNIGFSLASASVPLVNTRYINTKTNKKLCGHERDARASGGEYCGSCRNDIFGFNESDMKPNQIIEYIEQKIELINEYIK